MIFQKCLVALLSTLTLFGTAQAQSAEGIPPPPAPAGVARTPSPESPEDGAEEAPRATVEGLILQGTTGAPIEGARVEFVPLAQPRYLDWWVGGTTNRRPAATALSDAEGRFSAELDGGLYTLDASAEGLFQPGRETLSVTAGELVEGVELRLSPAAVLTGRVLDDGGQPVSSVLVAAVQEGFVDGRRRIPPCDGPIVSDGARQSTNELGEFRLFGLEAGRYYIVAGPAACDGYNWYYPSAGDPADAIAVTVTAGLEMSGINIRIPDNTEVYTASFQTVDPPGEEASASTFQVVRHGRDGSDTTVVISSRGRSLTEISPGSYETPPLPPGQYSVYYMKYGSRSVGWVTFDIVDRDVDAGLMTFAALVPIRGTVRSEGLDLTALYDELLVAVRPVETWHMNLWLVRSLMGTDGSGSFSGETAPLSFAGISEGRYRVRVFGLPEDYYVESANYGRQDVNRRGFFDASAATLSDTLDLVIAGPGGTVEGIVRDARDRPGAGSQVVLVPTGERRENPSAFQTAFADEAGRFSIRGVPPGDYGVLAWEDVPEGAWLNAEFLSDFETRMERLHIETTDREILDILVVAD